MKQQVLKEQDLQEDPPEGTVRAWTDGLEQMGVDGKQFAGYGVWFSALHRLNCAQVLPGQRQTNNRAEITTTLGVLDIVPIWVDLQVCTDSQWWIWSFIGWQDGNEEDGRQSQTSPWKMQIYGRRSRRPWKKGRRKPA